MVGGDLKLHRSNMYSLSLPPGNAGLTFLPTLPQALALAGLQRPPMTTGSSKPGLHPLGFFFPARPRLWLSSSQAELCLLPSPQAGSSYQRPTICLPFVLWPAHLRNPRMGEGTGHAFEGMDGLPSPKPLSQPDGESFALAPSLF